MSIQVGGLMAPLEEIGFAATLVGAAIGLLAGGLLAGAIIDPALRSVE